MKLLRLIAAFAIIAATVVVGAQTPTPTPTGTPTPTPTPTPLPFGPVPINNPEGIGSVDVNTTTFPPTIRVGNTVDRSGKFEALGVPINSLPVTHYLEQPPALDDDYFATAQIANTVGGTLTLANTSMPTNAASGAPFAISLLLTPSTTVTAAVDILFEDIQDVRRTVAVSWSASSSAVETSFTAKRIVSITVTDGFGASETIKVGYGETFGLPYPSYMKWGVVVARDQYSDDFPATLLTESTDWTYTAGAPDTTTGDLYGTIKLIHADTDPDGSASYAIGYNATLVWRRSRSQFTTYPSGTSPNFR